MIHIEEIAMILSRVAVEGSLRFRGPTISQLCSPHLFQTNLWRSSSLTGFFGVYPKWCSSATPSVGS